MGKIKISDVNIALIHAFTSAADNKVHKRSLHSDEVKMSLPTDLTADEVSDLQNNEELAESITDNL